MNGEGELQRYALNHEGLVPRLFQKIDVPVEAFLAELGRELDRRPKVSGPGVEPGKVYLTRAGLFDDQGEIAARLTEPDGIAQGQPPVGGRLNFAFDAFVHCASSPIPPKSKKRKKVVRQPESPRARGEWRRHRRIRKCRESKRTTGRDGASRAGSSVSINW